MLVASVDIAAPFAPADPGKGFLLGGSPLKIRTQNGRRRSPLTWKERPHLKKQIREHGPNPSNPTRLEKPPPIGRASGRASPGSIATIYGPTPSRPPEIRHHASPKHLCAGRITSNLRVATDASTARAATHGLEERHGRKPCSRRRSRGLCSTA